MAGPGSVVISNYRISGYTEFFHRSASVVTMESKRENSARFSIKSTFISPFETHFALLD